jgi:hypothetical protein
MELSGVILGRPRSRKNILQDPSDESRIGEELSPEGAQKPELAKGVDEVSSTERPPGGQGAVTRNGRVQGSISVRSERAFSVSEVTFHDCGAVAEHPIAIKRGVGPVEPIE